MAFDPEALRRQIPYYLTSGPEQSEFLLELKAINEGATRGYFISRTSDPYSAVTLQGDGWTSFQIYSFTEGSTKRVRGIVLSNSCDISEDNSRTTPPKITFAPLVKLARIRERFVDHGLPNERIESRLAAIRSQSVSSMFFVPADGQLDEDYVALLDDLHSMPVDIHKQAGEKLFTLSMAGFYLFIFKLSYHFCRLRENVDRRTPQKTG